MLTQITKTIRVNKDTFNSLTASQKRVAIAKDVLKQIKLGVFRAKTQSYIDFNGYNSMPDTSISLQKVIEDRKIECKVCAKGALFCSLVVFKNKIDIRGAYWLTEGDIVSRFKGIFSEHQLDMIENAFERKMINTHGNERKNEQLRKSVNFGNTHGESDEETLIAIMKNIVKNSGEFKP